MAGLHAGSGDILGHKYWLNAHLESNRTPPAGRQQHRGTSRTLVNDRLAVHCDWRMLLGYLIT